MEMQSFGSVVAMQFRRRPGIDFRTIVEEFDEAFQIVDSTSRALAWEGDDIATIDRDGLRVALGWLAPETEAGRWHLVIAVGAVPGSSQEIGAQSLQFLIGQIIEHTRERLPYTALLHGPAQREINAGLIEKTFDLLRLDSTEMSGDRRPTRSHAAFETDIDACAEDLAARLREKMAGRMSDADDDAQAHRHHGPHLHLDGIVKPIHEMITTRAKPTQSLRLTIHTLALSLCLLAPPLGAFMFTYSMLRDIVPMAA